MKALVTGGAGFIGSQIAESLCRKGASVVVLDDLSLGKKENLGWKKSGDNLEFVEGSITDEPLVRKVIEGCEWVFHEAALPSVPASVAKPWESNQSTLDGALLMLIAARDAGVKRLVFASSSAIYGNHPAEVKSEDLPPDPLSPYALQKYAAEKYCQLFYSLYGFEAVALRYFNVFGPRQAFNSPYSGVIAKFCTTMLAGKRPTIFGDGKQSRDFVYVANVVSANLLAAEMDRSRAAGQVFNVGGGTSIDLLQLMSELNRLTGQELEPQFEAARSGDVKASRSDILKIQQALGYQPSVTWQEGLKHTLDFYRNS